VGESSIGRDRATDIRHVSPLPGEFIIPYSANVYCSRWLRLLFTREFALQDSMVMWDGLLACDLDFNLAEWVCVAMLIRIRNQRMISVKVGV
jgi:hypothetical protein